MTYYILLICIYYITSRYEFRLVDALEYSEARVSRMFILSPTIDHVDLETVFLELSNQLDLIDIAKWFLMTCVICLRVQ